MPGDWVKGVVELRQDFLADPVGFCAPQHDTACAARGLEGHLGFEHRSARTRVPLPKCN